MSSYEQRQDSYECHAQPNGRPVHPACSFRAHVTPCACEKLWGGWDGTEASLDATIAKAMKDESRKRSQYRGTEMLQFLEQDQRKSWDGFWSTAENLRCVRGKNFGNGDLDMSRFKGGNWERAK